MNQNISNRRAAAFFLIGNLICWGIPTLIALYIIKNVEYGLVMVVLSSPFICFIPLCYLFFSFLKLSRRIKHNRKETNKPINKFLNHIFNFTSYIAKAILFYTVVAVLVFILHLMFGVKIFDFWLEKSTIFILSIAAFPLFIYFSTEFRNCKGD